MSDNNSNEISDLTDQKYLDICEEFKGVIEKKDKYLN